MPAKKEIKRASSESEESSGSPKKKARQTSTKKPFGVDEEMILLGAIIDLVLQNRRDLYKTSGLEDFNFNGGSMLNSKIKSMLTNIEKSMGGTGDMVKEKSLKAAAKTNK